MSACARATYPEKSMTTTTGSLVVSGEFFFKYFSVYWNCLKLCYFASKPSTSEDAPAISELPAFLNQMFHRKIFSQLDGKSGKLQKAVVGIISINETLIF